MTNQKRKETNKKEIDTKQVIEYLCNAFGRASRHLGYKNQKGSDLYNFQVELMYMIDDISRGPKYIVSKQIVAANELIDSVSKHTVG